MCLLAYVLFMKSEGYIKASLQVIRLIICVGILHPPKINSTRIFICMILILFLNINALFQSHLSALLTVPIYYRDIDTIESLKVIIKFYFIVFTYMTTNLNIYFYLYYLYQHKLNENRVIFSYFLWNTEFCKRIVNIEWYLFK